MAAERDPHVTPVAPARLRLRWLLVVVAIMVALTAGWPLANALVTDHQRLAAGTALRIGPSAANSAQFTLGPGWSQVPSQTNPQMSYVLRRGSLRLTVLFVALVNRSQLPELWTGLRKLVQVGNAGAWLSNPSVLHTAHGTRGLTGTVSAGNLTGLVAAFPAPSKGFAIEIVSLAPHTTNPLNVRATRLLMRSLRFQAAPR